MKRKVAIITGASSGIGRTVSFSLANVGYHVILIATSENKLNEVKKQIEKKGQFAEVYPLDVSNSDKVEVCISDVINKFGRIDVLFNNAGVATYGTMDISNSDLIRMVDVNLLGAIYVAKAVAKQMKKQKTGYIFNLSSIGGTEKGASRALGGYCATKFGLVGFSHSLHNELRQYGVKVTALCPGTVDTPMVDNLDFPKDSMIKTEDIAKLVIDMLSYAPSFLIKQIEIDCPAMDIFKKKVLLGEI